MTSLEVEAVTEELLVPLGNEGSATCVRWVLEEEDLEPTPIVAHAVRWDLADEDSTPAPFAAVAAAIVTMPIGSVQAPIHINEDKLFVQLGEKSEGGGTRWILDTGATNHMTGERSIFSELDTCVRGTVRFGDGSVVAI